MFPQQRTLAHLVREQLIHQALTPPPPTGLRLDDIAEHFGVSRTPAREALVDLTAVGLVEVLRYRGVRFTFGGPNDIRRRIQVLGAAIGAGDEPEGADAAARIKHCVGGGWGEIAWEVINAWPERAPLWGVDPRPHTSELYRLRDTINSVQTKAELGDAVLALLDVY